MERNIQQYEQSHELSIDKDVQSFNKGFSHVDKDLQYVVSDSESLSKMGDIGARLDVDLISFDVIMNWFMK